MDFDALLDFSTADRNEAEKARKLQRSDAELSRLQVPETVTDDVARLQMCLRGQPSQRLAALNNVARFTAAAADLRLRATSLGVAPSSTILSAQAEEVADKLIPLVCALVAAPPDSSAPGERACALQALGDVCRLKLLSASFVSSRILPTVVKCLVRKEQAAQGGTTMDEADNLAAGTMISALEARACTSTSVINDILPAAMSISGVSSISPQRCTAAHILAAVLVYAPPTSQAHRGFIDVMLTMCQDVDASVRACMATLLAAILPAIAGPSRRASLSGDSKDPSSSSMAIRLRDQCVEELCELLDDEDEMVQAAAAATASAVYDSSLSGIPLDARRMRILPRLRQLWERALVSTQATQDVSGQRTLMTTPSTSNVLAVIPEKDEPLTRTLAVQAGWLLYCGVQQSDMGVMGVGVAGSSKPAAESGRSSSYKAPAEAGKPGVITKGRRGSAVSPSVSPTQEVGVIPSPWSTTGPPRMLSGSRRRSMTRRNSFFSEGETASPISGSDQPAGVMVSLLQFSLRLTRHALSTVRLAYARALPGMFITCLHTAGPVPFMPNTAAGEGASSGHSKAVKGVGPGGKGQPTGKGSDDPLLAADVLLCGYTGEVAAFPPDSLDRQASFLFAVRDTLLPSLYRQTVDPVPEVRIVVAKSLVHIAAALGHVRASRLLVPAFMAMLQDNDDRIVSVLLDSAHTWLALVCPADVALRLLTFSALAPLLFGLLTRPAISKAWRKQLAFLASLRTLAMIFPAPQVVEASLTVVVGYLSNTGICKPVQVAAAHTLIWFMRHGPTARVRSLVRDYVSGRFGSAKSTLDTVTQLVSQMTSGSTSAGLSVASATDAIRVNDRRPDSKGPAPSLLVSVGGGVRLPISIVVQEIASARVPSPPGQPGPPLELLGPAWRRSMCVDMCAASLWLYSRQVTSITFLPPVLDAAVSDPVSSVRLIAVRALPILRAWFMPPKDTAAIVGIMNALDRACSDVDQAVARVARTGLEMLRRVDSAVWQAVTSQDPQMMAGGAQTLLCEQYSLYLRQNSTASSVLHAPAPVARRRSSISAAAIGAMRLQGNLNSRVAASNVDVFIPDHLVRLAALVAATTISRELDCGAAVCSLLLESSEKRQDLPAGSLPPALHAYVDGYDAIAACPALLRNPFRVGITGPLPCLPTSGFQALATAAAGFAIPSGSLDADVGDIVAAVYSCGMIPLDDVIGFSTGVVHLGDVSRHSSSAPALTALPGGSRAFIPYASPGAAGVRVAANFGEENTQLSSQGNLESSVSPTAAAAFVTTPVTGMSLGRLAILTAGRTPARQASSAFSSMTTMETGNDIIGFGPWETCVVWHPYSAPARVSTYHPLELVCPAPHSAAEEIHRQAAEAMLAQVGRSEEDVDRKRVIEERRREKDKPEKEVSKDSSSMTFSPCGWPAWACGAVQALAVAPPRDVLAVFPAAAQYMLHDAKQLVGCMPATIQPHLLAVSVGQLTFACNGPSSAGGIVTNPVHSSGGGIPTLASTASSPRLMQSAAGAAAGSLTPSQSFRVDRSLASHSSSRSPRHTVACFSSAAAMAIVTPAIVSSLIISLQTTLQGNTAAVGMSSGSPQLGATSPVSLARGGGPPADSLTALASKITGLVSQGHSATSLSARGEVASARSQGLASARASVPAASATGGPLTAMAAMKAARDGANALLTTPSDKSGQCYQSGDAGCNSAAISAAATLMAGAAGRRTITGGGSHVPVGIPSPLASSVAAHGAVTILGGQAVQRRVIAAINQPPLAGSGPAVPTAAGKSAAPLGGAVISSSVTTLEAGKMLSRAGSFGLGAGMHSGDGGASAGGAGNAAPPVGRVQGVGITAAIPSRTGSSPSKGNQPGGR